MQVLKFYKYYPINLDLWHLKIIYWSPEREKVEREEQSGH